MFLGPVFVENQRLLSDVIKTFNLREAIFLKSECRCSLRTEENRSPDSQIRGSGFFQLMGTSMVGKKSGIYTANRGIIWVFPRRVVSQNGWSKKWKTLSKWMTWGYHYFRKHPYATYHLLQEPKTTIENSINFLGSAHCVNTWSPPKWVGFNNALGCSIRWFLLPMGFSGIFGGSTCG